MRNSKWWSSVFYGEVEYNISGFLHPLTPHKRYCGIVRNGLLDQETEYANCLFFRVSTQFNHLIPEQNPNRYSDKQLEIFKLIQSLHKDGLGYRRIAKVLNERGLTTEEGHIWKSPNVYSVIKRYSERLERLKFRRKKYEPQFSKMWIEFTK